ncbi:hypothetical protein [Deinococcus reticulitermitis]|nr:hypothetical protein [Deinococcus reticulitermitis]
MIPGSYPHAAMLMFRTVGVYSLNNSTFNLFLLAPYSDFGIFYRQPLTALILFIIVLAPVLPPLRRRHQSGQPPQTEGLTYHKK